MAAKIFICDTMDNNTKQRTEKPVPRYDKFLSCDADYIEKYTDSSTVDYIMFLLHIKTKNPKHWHCKFIFSQTDVRIIYRILDRRRETSMLLLLSNHITTRRRARYIYNHIMCTFFTKPRLFFHKVLFTTNILFANLVEKLCADR